MTLFDELLFRAFKQRLADHLPNRVLPVSTEAPQDILALVDSEYANIAELLKPGRRARGGPRQDPHLPRARGARRRGHGGQ